MSKRIIVALFVSSCCIFTSNNAAAQGNTITVASPTATAADAAQLASLIANAARPIVGGDAATAIGANAVAWVNKCGGGCSSAGWASLKARLDADITNREVVEQILQWLRDFEGRLPKAIQDGVAVVVNPQFQELGEDHDKILAGIDKVQKDLADVLAMAGNCEGVQLMIRDPKISENVRLYALKILGTCVEKKPTFDKIALEAMDEDADVIIVGNGHLVDVQASDKGGSGAIHAVWAAPILGGLLGFVLTPQKEVHETFVGPGGTMGERTRREFDTGQALENLGWGAVAGVGGAALTEFIYWLATD